VATQATPRLGVAAPTTPSLGCNRTSLPPSLRGGHASHPTTALSTSFGTCYVFRSFEIISFFFLFYFLFLFLFKKKTLFLIHLRSNSLFQHKIQNNF
jgi:hypothetical protein